MKYNHIRVLRYAEIVAEFKHPETDAPMVTYWQTSDYRREESEFYSTSKKEFLKVWIPNV